MFTIARSVSVILVALCWTSCQSKSRYRPVDQGLDGAFAYSERDHYGEAHAISDPADVESKVPIQVPTPALVDIDSTLVVLANRTWQGEGQGDRHSDSLLTRKRNLIRLAAAVEKVMQERQKILSRIGSNKTGTVEDWSTYELHAPAIFLAIDRMARDQYSMRTGIPADSIDQYGDSKNFDEDAADDYRGSSEYQNTASAFAGSGFLEQKYRIQKELEKLSAEIEAEDSALENKLEEGKGQNQETVRLYAHLMRVDLDPIPLHLRGYDDLDKGSLVVRDRTGLVLSPRQLAELNEQMTATAQLAEVLEKMRKAEISTQKGLMEILRSQNSDLADQVDQLSRAVQVLTDRGKFDALVATGKAAVENAKDKEHTGELVKALEISLRSANQSMSDLLGLIERIRVFRSSMSAAVTPETIVSLLSDGAHLLQDVRNVLQDGYPLETVSGGLEAIFEDLVGQDTPLRNATKALANTDEGKAFSKQLTQYVAEYANAKAALISIGKTLKPSSFASPTLPTAETHAFDVPASQIMDTSLDLTRIDVKDGDRIIVQGEKRRGNKVVGQTEASFEITHYGWYGNLTPSVVLVRPTEIAGGDEIFQFAPILSWNQHYRPRPGDVSQMDSFARNTLPAIGMHAAFLPYDAQNGAAIGLGATVSFFNDRLQFGAGYNLMATSSDEGKTYLFIGSDLIGLLQVLNGGNK